MAKSHHMLLYKLEEGSMVSLFQEEGGALQGDLIPCHEPKIKTMSNGSKAP